MNDSIINGTLKDYPIRFFVADMTQTVEQMNRIHATTPVAAAAAGRTIIGTVLMAATLKYETDKVTVIVSSDGEIGRIIATADLNGNVKSEIMNPQTNVFLKDSGKLDVSKIVGKGTLTVIKDGGADQSYRGQVELVSGEIAEDFAYYYAKSEQIPTVVSLGVFVSKDLHILAAGGYMIQVMPGCPNDLISYLEETIASLPSITSLLLDGNTVYDIVEKIFNEYDFGIKTEKPINYYCDCSEEKIIKVLTALGKEELQSMIDDGEDIEVKCHFCNTSFNVTIDRLKQILEDSGLEGSS